MIHVLSVITWGTWPRICSLIGRLPRVTRTMQILKMITIKYPMWNAVLTNTPAENSLFIFRRALRVQPRECTESNVWKDKQTKKVIKFKWILLNPNDTLGNFPFLSRSQWMVYLEKRGDFTEKRELCAEPGVYSLRRQDEGRVKLDHEIWSGINAARKQTRFAWSEKSHTWLIHYMCLIKPLSFM